MVDQFNLVASFPALEKYGKWLQTFNRVWGEEEEHRRRPCHWMRQYLNRMDWLSQGGLLWSDANYLREASALEVTSTAPHLM